MLAICAALLALPACSSVVGAPDSSGGSQTGSADVGDGDGDETGSDTGMDETGDSGSGPGFDAGDGTADCDPWAQDCPDGEKCTYFVDGYETGTRCVPLDPEPKGPGETCHVEGDAWSGIDDCMEGALCHYVDENGFGLCVEMCGGSPEDPSCSSPDAMCQVCGNNDCASLCLATCDPLDPNCGTEQVCTPSNEGLFVCTPGGTQDGDGGYGAVCEFFNECDNGFACVPAEMLPGCDGSYCCTAYCDLSKQNVCPNELECVAFSEEDNVPEQYQHVGVCSFP